MSSLENLFVSFEQDIISACAEHEKENFRHHGYRRLIHFHDYIVNLATPGASPSKSRCTTHFARVTENDVTAPRIALIHHSFEHGPFVYAIIEPYTGRFRSRKTSSFRKWPMPSAGCVIRACPADVASDLWVRVPYNHAVFKDKLAPRQFTSVVALEKYLNKV